MERIILLCITSRKLSMYSINLSLAQPQNTGLETTDLHRLKSQMNNTVISHQWGKILNKSEVLKENNSWISIHSPWEYVLANLYFSWRSKSYN